MFVIGDWGYILFLAAADRELASSPTYFPFVDSYNSSDDPTCLRNVESIQENPRCSLVHLCAGNHLLHCLGRYLQQYEWGRLRYVSGSIGSPNAIQSNNPTLSRISPVTVTQKFNHKSCGYSLNGSPPQVDRAIPRFVLGAALMILSLIPTLRHMVELHKFTKRWQTNRLMKLLLREGAVYFVVYVQLHFCTMSIMIVRLCLRLKDHTKLIAQTLSPYTRNLYFNIVTAITLPPDAFMTFLNSLAYSLSCAIMPRFIISIRESYDRGLLSGEQGTDTGFGVFSHCDQIANGNAVWSAIAFADVAEQSQTLERGAGDSRTIQFDALGDRMHQV